jgi:putative addiction module component (TIGR02574 family)
MVAYNRDGDRRLFMAQQISIENLSLAEKIQLMERLWDDVCRESGDVQSPEWHRAVLEERTKRLADGTATVSSWADAKERLLKLGE